MKPDAVLDLEPYVAVGVLRFGMSVQDVHDALGELPLRTTSSRTGALREHYGAVQAFFDSAGRLQEVSFTAGGASLRRGTRILIGRPTVDNPIPYLLTLDPVPVVYQGFVLFFGIGLSVTGFHDHDDASGP